MLSVDFGVGTDSEGMWEKGHFAERYPGVQNPWKGGAASAPFDQRFYLAINVAVGGLTTYFPDGVVRVAGGGFYRVMRRVLRSEAWERVGCFYSPSHIPRYSSPPCVR